MKKMTNQKDKIEEMRSMAIPYATALDDEELIVLAARFKYAYEQGKKDERGRVEKLLEEIGEKFYYSSEIDGVSLKLNDLEEYKQFKKQKLREK